MFAKTTESAQITRQSLPDYQHASRLVTIGLGTLWIIDGLLQLQPQMFTQHLSIDVIGSALMSLPPALYFWSLNILIHFFMPYAAIWDISFAVLQLCIGISLIVGKEHVQKVGLWISIIWGSIVWVFAEGMSGILAGTMSGGVFPGTPSLINGFPGAALVYVLAALLLVFLPKRLWNPSSYLSVSRLVPALIMFVSAFVQAAPLMWRTFGQASIFTANSDNVPAQLVGSIEPLATFAASHPAIANSLELSMCLLSGVGLLSGKRWGSALALCWLGFVWWFGLGLGGILTGGGTDPNTPTAIALLVVPTLLWQYHSSRNRSSSQVRNSPSSLEQLPVRLEQNLRAECTAMRFKRA